MAKRVNLSRRLKAWRKREKLTHKEAGERLGINPLTYMEYEAGRRGKGINELTYQHIISLTARNGTKAKESSAVESSSA